jgi:RNA polymerase sigma factor (TIGR02999 family)
MAAEQILPLVYDELCRLADHRLSRERPGLGLQAGDLVHDAYLRLVNGGDRNWDGPGHFFAAADMAMRRILVENARCERSLKRGGGLTRRRFDEVQLLAPEFPEDLLALEEALSGLAARDPIQARIVEMLHFTGLTLGEAAGALGLSTTTAHRHWNHARAWLCQEIGPDPSTVRPR